MDVIDDVVDGLNFFEASGGVGVRCGITIEVNDGYRLSVGAWVYLCMLKAAFFVEGGDVFIESVSVGLGNGKGAMSKSSDSFVCRSLGNMVNGTRGSKYWFVSCVVQ